MPNLTRKPALTLPYPQETLRATIGRLHWLHCEYQLDLDDLLDLQEAGPLLEKWLGLLERRLHDQGLPTGLN